MISYLGIDVSKSVVGCAAAALAASRRDSLTIAEGFGRLHHFLRSARSKCCTLVWRQTGSYGLEVALFLHEAGYVVSVVNPARIKTYAESQLVAPKRTQVMPP